MASTIVGRRVTRKGTPPGLTLYAAAALILYFAVRRFIDGDVTIGVVITVVALVVAMAGGMLAGDAKRTAEVVSACPVCGIERQRSFFGAQDGIDWGATCGACTAYLRVNVQTLEVREESLDANLEGVIGGYWVRPEQYQSVVPGFAFKMPPICAVCGSGDAPEARALSKLDLNVDAGIIGTIASGVASDVGFATGFVKANRNYESNLPRPGAELDQRLSELTVPVCAKHARSYDKACEYSEGSLVFASYRYYKAFCELNRITAATTPSDQSAGPETAEMLVGEADRPDMHGEDRDRKAGS